MRKAIVLFILVFSLFSALFAQPGSLDLTFNPDDKGYGDAIQGKIFCMAIHNDEKIIVGGSFQKFQNYSKNNLVKLNIDGTLDHSFNSGTGINGAVYTITTYPDGKILVGGWFTDINGISRNNLARINSDGSLDMTFDIGTGFDDVVESIYIQQDQKIIVGGQFTKFNDKESRYLVKLNPDGSFDDSFTSFFYTNNISYGVKSIIVQPDQKIVVCGNFNKYKWTNRNSIARLHPNGELDPDFNPDIGSDQIVYSMVQQDDNKIVIGGTFSSVDGFRSNHIARLTTDGKLDNTFLTGEGFDNVVFSISIRKDGNIVVGGSFEYYGNCPSKSIVILEPDGELDWLFCPVKVFNLFQVDECIALNDGTVLVACIYTTVGPFSQNYRLYRINVDGFKDYSFNIESGFNAPVQSIVINKQEQILVGGYFSEFYGSDMNYFGSLNKNGRVNSTFNAGYGFNSFINAIAIQSDQKILIGGDFSRYNEHLRYNIARLNTNGTFDISFDPVEGFDFIVNSLSVQSDDKIVVCGSFSKFNENPVNKIARLNLDGTLDLTFNIGSGFTSDGNFVCVRSTSIQPDGKIIAGGKFDYFNNMPVSNIAKLNLDGSLDIDFNTGTGFNKEVYSIAIQSDGKLVCGGNFSSYNNFPCRLARILNDGSFDESFSPSINKNQIAGPSINSISIQKDGKILIGGNFDNVNGFSRNNIARLNPDGSLDTTFDPGTGFDNYVTTIAIQDDENIIVGGGFTSYNGIGRNRIARLIGSTGVLIPDPIPDQPILCYPNPTTGKVNIHLDKYYPDLSLTLVDIFGRTILQKHLINTQNIELELSSQPGLYFVTLKTADGWIKTIPVIKH